MVKHIEASCHCGCIRWEVDTHYPCPFIHCYCTACRKTCAGNGYNSVVFCDSSTVDIKQGAESLVIYRTMLDGKAKGRMRMFCGKCGSMLWLWGPPMTDYLEVVAGTINTNLPEPPERYHIFLVDKPEWVFCPPKGDTEKHFKELPASSVSDYLKLLHKWHKDHGLLDE